MNLRASYLLQIDRYRPGPRPAWHNFLPLDRAELFVLDVESVAHATLPQISALGYHLVQIYEGDLASMGLGIDLYEWDLQDKRLMRMICAAALAGRHPDVMLLKAKYGLREKQGTWDEAHWNVAFRKLVEDR
jgi:hypothetical protein